MNCFPVKLVIFDCVDGLTWIMSTDALVMVTRAARQDIFGDANVDDSILECACSSLEKIFT